MTEPGKGQALFDAVAENKKRLSDTPSANGLRQYDVVILTGYELTAESRPGQKADIAVNLPFNLRDDFKTSDYRILPADSRIKIYFKRTHTKANSIQHGIIYSLPFTATLE